MSGSKLHCIEPVIVVLVLFCFAFFKVIFYPPMIQFFSLRGGSFAELRPCFAMPRVSLWWTRRNSISSISKKHIL